MQELSPVPYADDLPSPETSGAATQRVSATPQKHDSAAAWRSPLLLATLSLLFFLTATGIYIFLAPRERTALAIAQYSVLLHTILGFAFIAPYLVYQTRHFLATWRHPLWYVAMMGYTSGIALLVTVVSGVVLTIEALFATRITPAWDLTHTILGIGMGVLVGVHLAEAAFVRGRGKIDGAAIRAGARRALGISSACAIALCALCAVPALFYRGLAVEGVFPQDYGYKYGQNPFAPSLAVTTHGGAVNPEALAGSKSCGYSGCHEEIVKEWEPSAHRYASRSYFFQIIQKTMASNNGAESTRYCGGCHDPIALFSGAKNIYDEDLSSLGADEGVSCAGCHSIEKTDVKGNANYVMAPPQRYLFEESSSPALQLASRFLIRSFPTAHVASYSRDLLKTPEFCGACHKQFIDKEINRVGWVQLQNQYDNWRKSHWFKASADNPQVADPKRTVSCRECHMRLSPSEDPSAGDVQDYNRSVTDGKHRSHRFIGANQWLPKLHELNGADEQVRLTEEWLRGETEIPEIAEKWVKGPAVPLELIVPETVEAGNEVTIRAITSSNKVGHDFPTGPLDIIQCWVELTVRDAEGKTVYETGLLDRENFIQEGSFMFKAEGVDKAGNLIDRHNLWDMVGARFRRSLFPGFSDTAEYSFSCPSASISRVSPLPPERNYTVPLPATASGELSVEARLRYRKVDQTLINFLAPGKGLTAPITDISTARGTIRVTPKKVAGR